MRKTVAVVAAMVVLSATPAMADPVIVDEPDTSDLTNVWTFAPLGVPVFGLLQSIIKAPNGIIPN
ncbi:hypothetical protein LWC34_28080 [Kibdelosporangium philippinense]|uniref:Secreted protein n=1 Tax=Kibdelosporangium philippinense TaxID=211113 RepID=A0ABS8ZHV8_9PSEU|nr:hypothetical protein [Kibdelosporangium philippinense]MCE7006658.1 hypothetical protein [Kibdelosporangium philippinense]